MVSVIAIGSGVFGSCFGGIRVEVRREILRIDLVCPGFLIGRSLPRWVCCQAALMGMVPGIGGCFVGLWVWLKKKAPAIEVGCGNYLRGSSGCIAKSEFN